MKGAYKRERQELFRKAEELDKKAETQLLTQQEIDLKQSVKDRIAHLLREEELKWLQRAKTMKLLHGDRNTKYFQAVANGKRRKTRILRLEQENEVIEGDEKIKKYITSYYKKLFQTVERNNFSWMSCKLRISRKSPSRRMRCLYLISMRKKSEMQYFK